jgi:hypothetical protein
MTDRTAARTLARLAPPPPPAPPAAPVPPAPSRTETFVRRNVDLTEDEARRLDRAVQEIADARGWRRGNVGDVLVTLARLMLEDVELQHRVQEAAPVPKRVKYVR